MVNETGNPLPDGADETAEWLARWRRQIRAPGAARDRLRAMADAVDAADSGEDCESLADMLEEYAAAVAHGADPAGRFPALEAHLLTCERCQYDLRMLTGAAVPPVPGFGRPALLGERGRAFELAPRSRVLSPARGLVLRFNPAYVAQRFQPGAGVAMRGEAGEPEWLTLLAESARMDDGPWQLRVQARHAAGDDRLTLCVEVMAEPQPALRARLDWGDATLSRESDAGGQICFDGLPAAVALAPEPRIALDIEVLGE